MISIAITAYKEPVTVKKAITSILNQNLKNFELIVCAPDKETLEAAKQTYKKVKLIKDPGKGKPTALNLIFKKAKGNLIILTDGDVYVGDNSLNFLLEKFSNPKIGAVSGRPVPINKRNNFWGYISYLLTDMADRLRKKLAKEGKFFVCSGYLYAIRKGPVKEIPPNILSDDAYASKIIWDKGYKIAYAPEAKVFVKYPTNLKDWLKQKVRSTGGYEQLKKIFGKKVMRSFMQEAFGILEVLKYPRSLKEFIWTTFLIILRAYLWAKIFIDIKLRKKQFREIWVRIESTK